MREEGRKEVLFENQENRAPFFSKQGQRRMYLLSSFSFVSPPIFLVICPFRSSPA